MAKQILSKLLRWLVLTGALSNLIGLSTSAIAAKPIVIGEITSQSGVFSFLVRGHRGAQLAVNQINAAGGVLGRPLKLLNYDDKSNPANGTNLFRELASENVLAVLGNNASPSVWAIRPLTLKLKTPFILDMSFDHGLMEKHSNRYLFRMSTSDRIIADAIAAHLAKSPATRYCTIANDFVYGRSITAAVMGRLKALKPSVKVIPGCQFWVPIGTLDFTPQITAILGKRPDALMFGGVVTISATAFVKQAKAFGLFRHMLGVHPSLAESVNSNGLQGSDIPKGIFSGSDYPYPPVDTPLSQKFFKAYEARWHAAPWGVSANAYTSVYLIAKAIRKAGKVSREALVDTLPGLEIAHPGMGNITISPVDHQSTAGWWFGNLSWDKKDGKVGLEHRYYVKGTTYLPTRAELNKIQGE